MNVIAILQARFSSTRLPGKVLMPLGNTSVLGQVVARTRSATRLNAVWVATSTHPTDDAVAAEAARLGAPCFRGSLEDVLARYHRAAQAAQADIIVRITADCPLFDGTLLDSMLGIFFDQGGRVGRPIEYLSNTINRTFPRGLDAEIFTFAALDRTFREAIRPYDREHVTPYIYNHPERFSLYSYTGQEDLSAYRWTLDTLADLQLIQHIHDIFSDRDGSFSTREVLTLMQAQPELRRLNAHIEQKKDPDQTGPVNPG